MRKVGETIAAVLAMVFIAVVFTMAVYEIQPSSLF